MADTDSDAILRVIALHERHEVRSFGGESVVAWCASCSLPWPCPTIRVLAVPPAAAEGTEQQDRSWGVTCEMCGKQGTHRICQECYLRDERRLTGLEQPSRTSAPAASRPPTAVEGTEK
jgi:hypothetical protein